jgi:hypothetical protein
MARAFRLIIPGVGRKQGVVLFLRAAFYGKLLERFRASRLTQCSVQAVLQFPDTLPASANSFGGLVKVDKYDPLMDVGRSATSVSTF